LIERQRIREIAEAELKKIPAAIRLAWRRDIARIEALFNNGVVCP